MVIDLISHFDIVTSIEGCVYDDINQQWVSLVDRIDTKIAKKNVAEALRSMSRDEFERYFDGYRRWHGVSAAFFSDMVNDAVFKMRTFGNKRIERAILQSERRGNMPSKQTKKISHIVELLDSVSVEDFVRASNQAKAYTVIQPMTELSDTMKDFSPRELASIFFDSPDFNPYDEWFAFNRAYNYLESFSEVDCEYEPFMQIAQSIAEYAVENNESFGIAAIENELNAE